MVEGFDFPFEGRLRSGGERTSFCAPQTPLLVANRILTLSPHTNMADVEVAQEEVQVRFSG